MSSFTRLVLGGAALAGLGYAGYKAKQHLDSQMEKPENYGLGYEDVAFEEAGKIIASGLDAITEGLAKGYEKIFDEPLYYKDGTFSVIKSANELSIKLRECECKHLNGAQLAQKLIKKSGFIIAEISRIDKPAYECDFEKFDKLNDEATHINDFIDAIYELEAQCYKAHRAILDFVFVAKDSVESSDKVETLGRTYSVASSKYDLDEVGEIDSVKSAIKSIKESCDRLATLNAELKSSTDSHAQETLNTALELAIALDSTIRGDFASCGGFCSERVEALQQSA